VDEQPITTEHFKELIFEHNRTQEIYAAKVSRIRGRELDINQALAEVKQMPVGQREHISNWVNSRMAEELEARRKEVSDGR
jgi:hypothetical protein